MRPTLNGGLTKQSTLWRILMPLPLLLGFAAPTHAADDRAICLRGVDRSTDADASLEACTRYISSGKARGGNLAAAYTVRATIFANRGEFDQAVEEANESIRLVPNSATLFTYRLQIYLKKGDYDNALADADNAVRLKPKSALLYLWRGDVYAKKRGYHHAIGDYTTAITLDPTDAEFYIHRCEAYDGNAEFSRALADCNEGLRRNPKLPSGYLWRGIAYENTGELDKAHADYEHVLSISPTLQDVRERLFALAQRSAAPLQASNDAVPAATAAGQAQPLATPLQVRQVLERHGMFGTWSVECSKLTSPGKAYSVYRLLGGDRVQREVITDAGTLAGIVESAVEVSPNELLITWLWEIREVVRLRVDGKRWQNLELTRNGTKLVAGGIGTANSDQPGKKAPWANQCQAPPEPGTSIQGSARQILEKYGLLGIWSGDCTNPPSPSNTYILYRALDEQRVQYDVMTHPTERDIAYIVESAEDAGRNEVSITRKTQMRDVYRLRIEGNRVRQLEFTRNGTRYVANGRNLANVSNPDLIGKEVPWINKCQ